MMRGRWGICSECRRTVTVLTVDGKQVINHPPTGIDLAPYCEVGVDLAVEGTERTVVREVDL